MLGERAQLLANRSRKRNKRSLYKKVEVGHARIEMHTMWGVRHGDKNHLYPLSPMETTGAAGGLGLSGPCLLAELRPSGLWIPIGLRPSLPSGMSLVPRAHGC